MVIGFGVRELAMLAGLDHSTAAKGLKELREEPDPFFVLVAEHHGEWADYYELVVPDGYAEAAVWRRWQPGRLGGIHPVFRERCRDGLSAAVHRRAGPGDRRGPAGGDLRDGEDGAAADG
ncbi:hypothetical protein ABZ907_47040 [Nonomuraea wenchangensis]